MLSVDIAEEKSQVVAFVEERELTFTVLLDQAAEAARAYEVRGIPTSFFIDREGVIQLRHGGALDESRVDEYAEFLLR